MSALIGVKVDSDFSQKLGFNKTNLLFGTQATAYRTTWFADSAVSFFPAHCHSERNCGFGEEDCGESERRQ